MELIGSLFLILAVGFLVTLFVIQPFLRSQEDKLEGKETEAIELDRQRSTLLAERDRVLSALQDLDFDHVLGKVPAEDFKAQRAALLLAGADALRRLDEISASSGQVVASESASMEERIEAEVTARRADSRMASAGSLPQLAKASTGAGVDRAPEARDELEDLIAARKRQRKESAAGFCPRCGRPLQKSDKFCSHCGSSIER